MLLGVWLIQIDQILQIIFTNAYTYQTLQLILYLTKHNNNHTADGPGAGVLVEMSGAGKDDQPYLRVAQHG